MCEFVSVPFSAQVPFGNGLETSARGKIPASKVTNSLVSQRSRNATLLNLSTNDSENVEIGTKRHQDIKTFQMSYLT